MKNFSQELHERVKAGTVGVRHWKADEVDARERMSQDRHLALWLAYLDMNGYHENARAWRFRARTLHAMGVLLPNCEPWAYDLSYNPDPGDPWRGHPSEQWAETRIGKHASEQTADERRETVESALHEVRKAAKHMQMFPDEPRRHPFDKPVEKPKTLDDLKREAQENPVMMSPTLASKLGINKENVK